MSKRPSTTAVLYMRCACIGQGDPIAEQREQLVRDAANQGLEVAAEYVDAGCSGLSATARPQLRKLLADAGKGLFTHLIARDLSRLSRGPELWALIAELQRSGVSLHFVDNGMIM